MTYVIFKKNNSGMYDRFKYYTIIVRIIIEKLSNLFKSLIL